jgi:flagellar basal-body rod protein FlgB
MAGFLFDSLYGGLKNVLDLRQQQQSLTASNLANQNTPGFRAKYIDFENTLGEAIYGASPVAMQTTDSRHMTASSLKNPSVEEVDPAPWSLDGNSVNSEKEIARLHSNSLFYQAVTKGVAKRLALLKYAANNGK